MSLIKAIMIEDDAQMREILTDYMGRCDISLTAFGLPTIGMKALEEESYDILLLDLTLPQLDGLDVCKLVKQKHNLPIIITSARGSVSDKVIGLEFGADDYLPKPFDPRELVARIKAHTRKNASKNSLDNGSKLDFTVHTKAMEIYHFDIKLLLTPAEYEILSLLIENRNQVLTRDQIVDNVESMKWASGPKSVDVIIGRIRQKIGDDPRNPKHIKSVKGFGYRFTHE